MRRFATATVTGLLLTTLVVVSSAGAPPVTASNLHAVAATSTGAWTVYHHDNAHTGYDSTQPVVSTAATGWVSPALTGEIYGEPLVYNGLVYVATLQNAVYALNQSDGTVAWSASFGPPQTSGWQCGNINPTGTLGTGVIDVAGHRIYYAPFLHSTLSYWLFGLDLTTGVKQLQTEIAPSTFDWTIQQQRGALALSHDGTHVYVPFGGRAGDCGSYHGWVAGIPTNGAAMDETYETFSTGEGIWAGGGVVVDDATSNVFFATGNAIPCGPAHESDSVIRTNSVLGSPVKFQPPDWSSHWCGPDSDLGSVSPILITPNLIFQTGKYGQGLLVNTSTMGQAYPARSPYVGVDVCNGVNIDASFGAEAYANGRLYLTCENNGASNGIVSLSVNTSSPSFSSCDSTCTSAGTWQAAAGTTLGPPIVAGGAVWAVSTSGGGLFGFDASTGAQIFNSAGFSVNRFSTPSEAGGQIFVGAGNVVRSFNMVNGCSSATLSAAPPNQQQTGSAVTMTATASGPNCTSPQFQFWIKDPFGTWSMVQDYSASNSFTWTAPVQNGPYYLGVHVKHLGSAAAYEAVTSIQYLIASPTCSSVTLSAAPASPQPSGTQVTLTASASGCSFPAYEFWASFSPNQWQIIRAYSTTPTYVWNSTGAPTGTYHFGIWACHDSVCGHDTSDTLTSIPYSVTAPSCASVTISATPTSVVHGAGTHVTITGAATGCTTSARYEFWMRAASQTTWQLVQGWGPSNTYNWNSTGALPGIVYFGVWTRDTNSTATYDAVASTTETVT